MILSARRKKRPEAFFNRIGMIALLVAVIACGSRAEVDFARSLAVKAPADLVLRGGKIITLDRGFSIREAVAIRDRHFIAVGTDSEMRPFIGPQTQVVELRGRTVIPGLIDSQIYATVAGLSWDAELHWERLRSLADGLKQIAAAAKTKPAGTWIVVAGGWAPTQFSERRFPSRTELDELAPNHPVYIQYLGQSALLNSAAIRAAGLDPKTLDPPGGKFEKDPKTGELTGWVRGVPAWRSVYNKIPQLPLDQARQSLKNCFTELNRMGITSVNDFQTSSLTFAYRRLLSDMARNGELTVRIDFYIAPGSTGDETDRLKSAVEELKSFAQSDFLRFAGFGPTLVPGIEDDNLLPGRDLTLDSDVKEKFRRMSRLLAESSYNFHLQITHDEVARQLLDVLEQVNSTTPFAPRRIGFGPLVDATPETIARIKKLGGGISVQDSLVLIGEKDAESWGLAKARRAPPLRTMMESGVPLGAGTDAFQKGNFSPMLSLWWLVTGKTVGGAVLRDPQENLTRQEALRAYTTGSAWFTLEERGKGSIEVDKLADLVVLNGDYLTIPEDQIPALESLLTIVNGHVVYAASQYRGLQGK